MSSWQTAFSIAASFFSISYFLPYIFSVLKGKTKPCRASWWIWTIIAVILCFSYAKAGGGITVVPFICAGIGQFIVAVLSLRYGTGGWTRLDKLCFLGAAMSLLLWWYFSSPFIAIVCNVLVDLTAVIPTLKKTYKHPESEDLLAWSMYGIGSFLNLFTLQALSIDIVALPVYVLIVNVVTVALIARPKLAVATVQISSTLARRRRQEKYSNRINLR